MEAFWAQFLAIIIKYILEWLTQQNEERAKKLGEQAAVVKKAYEDKSKTLTA